MSSIVREIWLIEKVFQSNKPSWNCPSCNSGILNFPKEWSIRKPNAYTQREHEAYLREFPDSIENNFTGFLKCSNGRCKENVAVIGYSSNHMEYNHDSMHREPFRYYVPKFFYPPIQIFRISEHCPENIKNQIQKSFSHFFNDLSASANSIRTALELILDQQKVRKNSTSGGKRSKLTLHARIEFFGNENPDLKPFIMAAKWIGNAGSHNSEIDKDGLLDGFELLEHCIDDLYAKKHRMKELMSKAKSINKKKKPITKKKK